jgi:hypothetical protein
LPHRYGRALGEALLAWFLKSQDVWVAGVGYRELFARFLVSLNAEILGMPGLGALLSLIAGSVGWTLGESVFGTRP